MDLQKTVSFYPGTKRILIVNYDRLRHLQRSRRLVRLSRLPFFITMLVSVMRFLGYRFATVAEAMAADDGRFVCITFDGAYRDVSTRVFPLLFKLKVPATIFAVTGQVGRRNIVPRGLGLRRRTAGLGWEELRKLVSFGWEVGVQGHNYVNLTERSQKEQHQQIQKSMALVKEMLGMTPQSFAYPYGACDASTVKFLREEGFRYGVTLRKGLVDERVDPYQLPRVAMAATRIWDYALLLKLLFFAWLPGMKQKPYYSSSSSQPVA